MARFTASRGLLVDGVLVLACVALMHIEFLFNDASNPGPWSSLTIVATSLVVLLRRIAPAIGFVLAMLMLFAVLETACVYNTMPIVPVILGFTMADRHGLRAALLCAPPAVFGALFMIWAYGGHTLFGWEQAKNIAIVLLPLALGVAAHDRRAYTHALIERAEEAERNREEEALRRVGEERLRIARDVHDIVAHAMVTINVQAGVGAHLLAGDADTDKAHATLRDIKKVSGDALSELRSMLGILRARDETSTPPAPVHPVQQLSDIDGLTESLASAGVELHVEVGAGTGSLPAPVESAGYRIVQEALTNVIRHAGPTRVDVRITRSQDQVVIQVCDRGGEATAPLQSSGSGNGLRGMRERAGALGGSLEAGPRSEGGWQVLATLPLHPAGAVQ